MTEFERMLQGKLFLASDPSVQQKHRNAKRLCRVLNETTETQLERRRELMQELFACVGEGAYIEPPFYCDFGINTTVGKNFYTNYNCYILDVCDVTIGDNVMFAPNVGIYAASHPIDPFVRSSGLECGKPVKIGNNVWIGGHSCVCPGVTIGDNVVIGAGSVVCKDIPDNVVAAGNPCRVIRRITEEERLFWQEQMAQYNMEMRTQINGSVCASEE